MAIVTIMVQIYGQEFLSLCKTWNIGIRTLFGLPYQKQCRFIQHVYGGVHSSLMLKCRNINFMVGNLEYQNELVQYVA